MSKSHTLAREREIRAGAWTGDGGLHSEGRQVSRRGRVSKQSLPKRSIRKHKQVSECKSSSEQSAVLVSLQVWPNLKWERRLGDEEPAHKMAERNESG